MCTGAEIALPLIAGLVGTVTSVVGGAIEQKEAKDNTKRQADARNRELKRTLANNDALAERSRAAFNQRKQKAATQEVEKDRQAAADMRTETVSQASERTPQALPALSGAAPEVVSSTLSKKMAEAAQYGRDHARRRAELGSYGDSWLSQGFKDADTGRDIATTADFARGNLSMLPFAQDAAEMKAYKPITPLGGLIRGLGQAFGGVAGGVGGGGAPQYKSPWM